MRFLTFLTLKPRFFKTHFTSPAVTSVITRNSALCCCDNENNVNVSRDCSRQPIKRACVTIIAAGPHVYDWPSYVVTDVIYSIGQRHINAVTAALYRCKPMMLMMMMMMRRQIMMMHLADRFRSRLTPRWLDYDVVAVLHVRQPSVTFKARQHVLFSAWKKD